MKNYNISEFANLAGVSAATVSRVFSGSPKVQEKTRTRILQLAKKHNFRPNRAAAAAFHRATHAIGIVIFGAANNYFNELWHGVQDTLMARSYLPIALVPDDNTPLITVYRRLYDQRIDGMITIDWRGALSATEEREFTQWKLPCVMVDSFTEPPSGDVGPCDMVGDDNRDGARQVAEYLFAKGHRRCAVFCNVNLKRVRMELFAEIFTTLGGETVFCDKTDLPGILQSANAPTALFGYTDNDAAAAVSMARELGLRVPEDLSVIGFADLDFAKFLHPRLTTVRQNGALCGKTAAEMLLRRLENPKLPLQHKLLPVTLIERQSVSDTDKAPAKK